MKNQKLKLIIKDAIQQNQTDLVNWIKTKYEQSLTTEEQLFLNKQSNIYAIAKILYYESTYLNEEELMHRINQIDSELQIPKVLEIVTDWSKQHNNLNNLLAVYLFLETKYP